MRVGIIGAGAVGAATAMAIIAGGKARELVIVNRDRAKAAGMATDMRYGAPLSPPIDVSDGDYDDLAGAQLLILTAGVNEKDGGATDRDDSSGRLRLLGKNIEVFENVVPRMVKAAPDAPILVLTDPPDPLVDVARHYAGHERVLATSTFIDSLRFRVHLAQRLGVNPRSVEAQVIGEHGTSSVFLWSSARVGGAAVQDLLHRKNIDVADFREQLEKDVRQANITIIEGIGASQYGIGMVAARVAAAILGDERAVFPTSSYNERYGVSLSLPSVVGRDGVSEIIWPELSDDETEALEKSADAIKTAAVEAKSPAAK
jgi:L-lactate dehydrogenase